MASILGIAMKQSKITFNLEGMDDLRKQIGDNYVARVGILGEKASRSDTDSGLNNAEIGFIQMFGSVTNNIPPRDFLMLPLQHEKKEFVKAVSGPTIQAALAGKNYKKIFQLLGLKAEEFIQRAFETGGFGQWPANSPRTIAAKGSARPLIDTGQLRRAITSEVVKKGAA